MKDGVNIASKAVAITIAQHRKRARLKQRELAEMIGITPASLASIENGYQRISIDVIFSIAEALKVSVYDLIPEKKKPKYKIEFVRPKGVIFHEKSIVKVS